MKKYYIIFDDDNNIINEPQLFVAGTAIVSNYNFLVGTKETILTLFPEAIFPESI